MENFNEIHIEQDFWDDFIVEAFENLEDIETNAMSLEQNPEDMDIVHAMFRAFHTIKGLAGFVEHVIIQKIAHRTETMMDYCRKGEMKVTTEIVNAILRSADYIKKLCDNTEAYKDEGLMSNIYSLLDDLERISNSAENSFVADQSQTSPAPAQEQAQENVESQEGQPVVAEQPQEGQGENVQQVEENQQSESQPQPSDDDGPYVEQADNSDVHTPEGLESFANEIESFNTDAHKPEEKPVEQVAPAPEPVQPVVQEPVAPVQQTPQPQPVQPVVQPVQAAPQEVEQAPQQLEVMNKLVEGENALLKVKEEHVELTPFQKRVCEKLSETCAQQEHAAALANKNHSPNEEYMKVASSRIDHLVDMMGELIISQALIEQYVNSNYSEDKQLTTNMSGFLRITRELQNLSMSLRMVALKPTFQKLMRIARDTIQELHKNVEFVVTGENTEIDRAVAEKLLEPLVHMIKNAISHGVEENPEDRVKLGKPERARVELNAYNKRGKIFIEVKDDGRGINTEVVYQKALEKGLIDESRNYTEAEIREFIMLPGFSTAKVVDNISGRGVGMDVVKTQIQKTGGKVEVQSELNKGSTFVLEVPVNHAIMNGTVIEMNNQHFVVPTINVKEFLQPKPEQWIFTKQERTMIRVRENIIPIVPVSTFFKGVKEPENVPLVMVLELDQELRAVPIVNVINRQEVVVKPVGAEFQHLKYVSGMSILGTGKVSLILDIDYLFKKEVIE